MIPYGRHSIDEKDIEAVVSVLKSDFLTQGPMVPRFERAVAEKTGAKHGVAVNSATSALHIACLALGVGPGDVVWTTPNTFVASANCARYCGAGVDFVDIDSKTWNISVSLLAEKLASAEAAGSLPKVLIPVHFSGQSCDMASIAGLADKYGFRIIEDASHAIGATYSDGRVGDCRYSDIAVFSFHPVKIITTGEGGLALTNDDELAWRMSVLRTHGITRDPDRMDEVDPAPWKYEQRMLGYNYRMIDLEAALGLSQLLRLDEVVQRRNAIARRYDKLLDKLPLIRPTVDPSGLSAFHLYVVRLPEPDAKRHRRVFENLRRAGIGVNVHYSPVHLQPDFQNLGFGAGMYPEAEAYGQSALSLPIYPELTHAQQGEVVAALVEVLT